MDFIGSPQTAVKVSACEGEACVRNEVHLKSKIPCHADCRFYGIFGAYSGDDKRLNPTLP